MRKSIFRTGVAALLLSCMLVATAFAEEAVVTGNDVNLRSGPAMNYNVLACLAKGTSVTVTDRSNPDWYAVTLHGVSGYISSGYIKVMEESASSTPIVSNLDTGTINAMYVRFRSGPSTENSILGEYNKGKTVTVTGTVGDWSAVIIDGQSGYIYSQYISTGYEAPAPEAPPAPEETPKEPEEIEIGGEEEEEAQPPEEEVYEEPEAETAAGYINGDDVRFRSGPSTSYTILGSYNKGKQLTITGASGDWTAVSIDGRNGYVFSQYVAEGSYGVNTEPAEIPEYSTEEGEAPEEPAGSEGYITGNNVRFRTDASMSAGIITELFFGNSVTITGTVGDWTAVICNGRAGYVYSQYVSEGSYSIPSAPETESPEEEGSEDEPVNIGGSYNSVGADVAAFACRFVGYNYCWGGKSPDTGFDCSGLVYYSYSQFGYTLNRIAQDQASNGVHVDASELQPGDVLCFYSGSDYIGHSGIYIGDNKFVHAASSSTGVIISELSGYYASRGFEARRIVF